MDSSISNMNSASEAHPESLDFLSRAWCHFAVQTLQSDHHELNNDQSIILRDPPLPLERFDQSINLLSLEKSAKLDDAADFQSMPPTWKSNDFKSWIWMQQAMHPELNYNTFFRKKWKLPTWKIVHPFKKWLKEMKSRRKEEERLQRAQVHAAISVAGVAAALAAIASAENTTRDESTRRTSTKNAAVASAAALVAAQCAKVAEAMGANKEQLNSAIGSAMCGTSDIITLTAAATTSLRGAETLEARSAGCKKILDSISKSSSILPIEDKNDFPFEFDKCRSVLAKGAELGVQTPDGKYKVRLVSIALGREGKVLVEVRKLNLFKSKKKSFILDLHAELYRDDEDDDSDTCYMLVLITNVGTIKLDMGDDYQKYKTWAATINHMLHVSTSFTKYQLQYYTN